MAKTKSKKTNWLLWGGLGAAALLAFISFKGKGSSSISPEQLQAALLSKMFIVDGWSSPRTGASLNINVQSDGSILIGDGYRGSLSSDGTAVITTERNGKAEGATAWRIVA